MRWLAVALAVVVLLFSCTTSGLLGGVVLDRQVLFAVAPPYGIPSDAGPDFTLMAEAWNVIHTAYVDRTALRPTSLTYAAISGMTDSLGDTGHSRFLTPQMVQSEHSFVRGEFEGVGLELQIKDGNVVVVAPIDGSPAQQAGLHSGDIILKVDGQDVAGLPLEQVVARILGPAGTEVTLTILSPSTGQTHDVRLTRARITVHHVTWHQLPGTKVAHVRVSAFSQGVTKDLQQVLTETQRANVTGLILDLRGNPGGLLPEAVSTASQFLTGGNVLLVKDVADKVTPIPVEAGGPAPGIPLVVLVNGGTASAAEIVTGALQDAHRATVVGEITFGTGTVLQEFPLSDGSVLLLATQEWLTPDGRAIWHQGLTPDIAVTLPSNVAAVLPEAERDMTAAQLQSSGDAQLLRALALLIGSAGQ